MCHKASNWMQAQGLSKKPRNERVQRVHCLVHKASDWMKAQGPCKKPMNETQKTCKAQLSLASTAQHRGRMKSPVVGAFCASTSQIGFLRFSIWIHMGCRYLRPRNRGGESCKTVGGICNTKGNRGIAIANPSHMRTCEYLQFGAVAHADYVNVRIFGDPHVDSQTSAPWDICISG